MIALIPIKISSGCWTVLALILIVGESDVKDCKRISAEGSVIAAIDRPEVNSLGKDIVKPVALMVDLARLPDVVRLMESEER